MRVPIVSLACGILAAVAAGFLFDNQFQPMKPGAAGVIEGLVYGGAFLLAMLATRGR